MVVDELLITVSVVLLVWGAVGLSVMTVQFKRRATMLAMPHTSNPMFFKERPLVRFVVIGLKAK
jgi:hypothetical protein